MSDISEQRDRFIEAVSNFGSKFGLNSALSQIYALLYWEGMPLSLEEISHTLKMSKGNVSLNIRKLEEWGAVRKVWKKGSNRHFYRANPHLTQFLPSRIKDSLTYRMGLLVSQLESLTPLLKEESKKKRVQELKNLTSRVKKLVEKIFDERLINLTLSSGGEV